MLLIFRPKFGQPPVTVEVADALICNDQGTPLSVATEYGVQGAVKLATIQDTDFNNVLRSLGLGPVDVLRSSLVLPQPTGSKLIGGPGISL